MPQPVQKLGKIWNKGWLIGSNVRRVMRPSRTNPRKINVDSRRESIFPPQITRPTFLP